MYSNSDWVVKKTPWFWFISYSFSDRPPGGTTVLLKVYKLVLDLFFIYSGGQKGAF